MDESEPGGAAHATHTGRTAHHDDRVQFLIVGDESSLTEIEAELALLPLCARGRVFVEVPEAVDIVELHAPQRMVVTWLPRSVRGGRPGTAEPCAAGTAVRRAAGAWCAEMLCDGPGRTTAVLTGDYHVVSGVWELLVDGVGMSEDAVKTPAAFGLHASR